MQKSIVFCVAFFMSGNDQYGRRLWGDTAEIFGFTFWYTDALPSDIYGGWPLLISV